MSPLGKVLERVRKDALAVSSCMAICRQTRLICSLPATDFMMPISAPFTTVVIVFSPHYARHRLKRRLYTLS
jgi:hypothetical protein